MAYSGTGADITSSTGTNLTTTTQQSVNLTAGSSTTIGTVTVTGSAAPTEGVAESYTVAFDGDATDATYLWTTTDGSATIATPTAATTDITFSTSGSFTVTCTVSSATASDSPASDDLAVTVAAAGPTVLYTFTDTMDTAFGTGSSKANPSSSPSFTFFSAGDFVGIRDDVTAPNHGIAFDFGVAADLSVFTSAHPSGTLNFEFSWTSGPRVGSTATASSATYTISPTDRLWITKDQFTGGDGWAAIAPVSGQTGVSDSFILVISQ
jgi:hypothetical protein